MIGQSHRTQLQTMMRSMMLLSTAYVKMIAMAMRFLMKIRRKIRRRCVAIYYAKKSTKNSPTPEEDDKESLGSRALVVPTAGMANKKKQFTIKEAWERHQVHSEQRKSKARSKDTYLFVHLSFYCNICCDHGTSTISFGYENFFLRVSPR